MFVCLGAASPVTHTNILQTFIMYFAFARECSCVSCYLSFCLSLCVCRTEATRCAPAKTTVRVMMFMMIMLPTGKSLVLFIFKYSYFYPFFCAVRCACSQRGSDLVIYFNSFYFFIVCVFFCVLSFALSRSLLSLSLSFARSLSPPSLARALSLQQATAAVKKKIHGRMRATNSIPLPQGEIQN